MFTGIPCRFSRQSWGFLPMLRFDLDVWSHLDGNCTVKAKFYYFFLKILVLCSYLLSFTHKAVFEIFRFPLESLMSLMWIRWFWMVFFSLKHCFSFWFILCRRPEMSTDKDWIGLQLFFKLADRDCIWLKKFLLFNVIFLKISKIIVVIRFHRFAKW